MEVESTAVSLGQFGGLRCLLLHDTELSSYSTQDFDYLSRVLNIDFRSYTDEFSIGEYDVVGLLNPTEQLFRSEEFERSQCLKICFLNSESPIRARVKGADATVICRNDTKHSMTEVSVIRSFFESLTVPSLLNIDLADVRSIAKGIGIAFCKSGDSSQEIVDILPRECFVARSALLHYSCAKDVLLNEIYEITKAISVKQPDGGKRENRRPPNMKMGLRVLDSTDQQGGKRIRLTAILFGI